MFAYDDIGRPPHEFGASVYDPLTYRGLMVLTLRGNKERFPARKWGIPHRAEAHELRCAPFVNHGIWKIGCSCGDHPIYWPEYGEANCFLCGAMFVDVQPPKHYRDIEAILLKRPQMVNRNWTPDETLDDLRAQNLAAGDPI